MKTNQELLDFYGVEVGKKYIVTKGYTPLNKGDTFEIEKNISNNYFHLKHRGTLWGMHFLTFIDYEEVKPEILTNKEKKYLSAVIKPFRDKVEFIQKITINAELEYIRFGIRDEASIEFPNFDAHSMYKGMEPGKGYKLEELGL